MLPFNNRQRVQSRTSLEAADFARGLNHGSFRQPKNRCVRTDEYKFVQHAADTVKENRDGAIKRVPRHATFEKSKSPEKIECDYEWVQQGQP